MELFVAGSINNKIPNIAHCHCHSNKTFIYSCLLNLPHEYKYINFNVSLVKATLKKSISTYSYSSLLHFQAHKLYTIQYTHYNTTVSRAQNIEVLLQKYRSSCMIMFP